MSVDEIESGLVYVSMNDEFPELFTVKTQEIVNAVLQKWSELESDYESMEEAIAHQYFSKGEIKAYALWRAAIYYCENSAFAPDLAKKCFEATAAKLADYYLSLYKGL